MKDVLSLIVDAEKEINETLRREKHRLEEWVTKEKKRIDAEIAEKRAGLEEEAKILVGSIKKKAEEEASLLISQAKEFACRIEGLDDEKLKEIVGKYLERVVR